MIATALEALPGFVLSVFLVFCRVGSCLMLIPANGSARVPVQVRLMLCLGASAAVAATIGEPAELRQGIPPLTTVASLVAVETGKGLFISFMARFFFAMLQFLAEAAANAIGLSPMVSSAEDGEMLPAMASLITITASALFVITTSTWKFCVHWFSLMMCWPSERTSIRESRWSIFLACLVTRACCRCRCVHPSSFLP